MWASWQSCAVVVITIGYLAANQQMISNTVVYTNSRETFVAVSFKPRGLIYPSV